MAASACLTLLCVEAGHIDYCSLRLWFPRSTDLLEPTVLLHQRRQHAGAAGWRGFHIVVPEAAEERAKDAPAPLLL